MNDQIHNLAKELRKRFDVDLYKDEEIEFIKVAQYVLERDIEIRIDEVEGAGQGDFWQDSRILELTNQLQQFRGGK